jgi:threonine dehydratase
VSASLLGDPDAVRRAAARLATEVVHTPLLSSPTLDRLCRAQVWIKPECLQIGGSFKYRGALNKLLQLQPLLQMKPRHARHVVAYSSGNHAIAIACAAAHLDCKATLVMPADAPAMKVDRVRAEGGSIEFYDRKVDDRVAHSELLGERLAAPVIPSFDDPDIIVGQATLVLEMLEDARGIGVEIDDILVPCGGGGLLAGAVLAVAASKSNARIYAVEPAGFDDMARSLASGRRESNTRRSGSICDSLLIERPGELTFPIIAGGAHGGITVCDDEVAGATRFAFRNLKLVVEPGGAVALAAVLAGKVDFTGRTVGVVFSGGNVDSALFGAIIAGESAAEAAA